MYLQYIVSRMSYLIDQFDVLLSLPNKHFKSKQRILQSEDQELTLFRKDLEKRGQNIGQDKIVDYEMHAESQQIFITVLRSFKIDKLNFIQKLTYNKKRQIWQIQLNIVTEEQRYLKISGPSKLIQFIKAFSKLLKSFPCSFTKAMINVKSGVLVFRFTDYFLPKDRNREIIKASQRRIDIFLQQLIKNHSLVQILSNISNKMLNIKQKNQLSSKFIGYGKKIGIFLSLGENSVENSIILNQSKQVQTKNETLALFTEITQEQLKMLKLFSPYDNRSEMVLKYKDLQWQPRHKNQIANKVKMPVVSNCVNRLENNCIFNFIKISNGKTFDLHPLNHGGFAKIFSAYIQYWYVYSNSNGQLVPISDDYKFTTDKLLRKIMIIKRQSGPESRPTCRRRNRVDHEIRILKEIKNSKAVFVPKYYVSAEQNCLGSDLLSDHLLMPSIMEYFNCHRSSISIFTKMYILFMIVQGVRYLKQNGIVHLDLKPNNIMISKSMMIKIIDYGESYHPNVCKSNHLPGLTMPYSSPQNYSSQKSFTQKSDVFSIGVMAYQIFYQRFPFFLYSEKAKSEVFLYKQYPDYWFYNHEELQCHGDRIAFPFFQYVIGRCLDPDQNRRPQLDWLCAVIRQSFDFYA